MRSKTPLGMKILGTIYLIGAITSLTISIFFFMHAGILSSLPINLTQSPSSYIAGGIFFFILTIIACLIGVGLWIRKKWSVIATIIFAVLGLVMVIIDAIMGDTKNEGTTIFLARIIIGFVVNLSIIMYLIFSKNVKLAISKNRLRI